jgi:hypothetical protein
MQWTPDGTLRNALWIGGGQWAGKTTVAGLLTDRFHLVHYHYDYHDARGHEDRRIAARLRHARKTAEAPAASAHTAKTAPPAAGAHTTKTAPPAAGAQTTKAAPPPAGAHTAKAAPPAAGAQTTKTAPPAAGAHPTGVATTTIGWLMRDVLETDWEAVWIGPSPAEMAERVLAGFPERFGWVLDDLRGIVTPHPVLVDGWGLRPELVAAITDPARMVVLAPTVQWRRHQAAELPRARYIGHPVSDPELAARNRFERDGLITEDAVREAHRHGIRVIEVDGTRPAEAIADEVADHFRPFLP